MSIQTRVLNIYRANESLGITQLRLGRVIRMEHKGHLDKKTDADILALLDPNNVIQKLFDDKDLAMIRERQK